jgi:hypothetical protein
MSTPSYELLIPIFIRFFKLTWIPLSLSLWIWTRVSLTQSHLTSTHRQWQRPHRLYCLHSRLFLLNDCSIHLDAVVIGTVITYITIILTMAWVTKGYQQLIGIPSYSKKIIQRLPVRKRLLQEGWWTTRITTTDNLMRDDQITRKTDRQIDNWKWENRTQKLISALWSLGSCPYTTCLSSLYELEFMTRNSRWDEERWKIWNQLFCTADCLFLAWEERAIAILTRKQGEMVLIFSWGIEKDCDREKQYLLKVYGALCSLPLLLSRDCTLSID